MLFSSISFIYYFLPIVLLAYFIVPFRYKNAVLLISSLVFYFFGEPKYTIILVLSTLVDYSHSLVIEKYRGTSKAKIALISSIVINLGMLGFFKYADFFMLNSNTLFGTDFSPFNIALPIGISFFTFQTMSYTIDVYRNQVPAQRNLWQLGTYVTLFPQLVAGPIVRYKTVAEELIARTHSFEIFSSGVNRFVLGLAKKVLLANQLGELSILSQSTQSPSVLFLWLGALAFALQIYFDFSGYSDMAIGLGRMFGFHFLENFNYPYISKSVTEFWTRWHISLGTWFKDYVYIPMGGNRVSPLLWYRNILFVWLITGFWHGASWNFVLWGLYFAIILVLEKKFLSKLLKRTPDFIRHCYVTFAIVISFVIFNHDSLSEVLTALNGLFGLSGLPLFTLETSYYLQSYLVIILISVICATPLLKIGYEKLMTSNLYQKISTFVEPLGMLLLLLVVTGYLVDASFNPFLYFRF